MDKRIGRYIFCIHILYSIVLKIAIYHNWNSICSKKTNTASQNWIIPRHELLTFISLSLSFPSPHVCVMHDVCRTLHQTKILGKSNVTHNYEISKFSSWIFKIYLLLQHLLFSVLFEKSSLEYMGDVEITIIRAFLAPMSRIVINIFCLCN